MGIPGRRTAAAIIEQIIAMRLRNIPYRTIRRELGVGFEFIWQVASKKVLRQRRRENEAVARAKFEAACERFTKQAEEARRGAGGGDFRGFSIWER